MDMITGIVVALGIVGAVVALVAIVSSLGVITMIIDEKINGRKVTPERVPYSERTVQGGQVEAYYVEMLKNKQNNK
jgi:DNA-binding transcriptional regulator YdaS (Cro superfamily)